MAERTGCLLAILNLFGGAPSPAKPLPYRRKDFLLTKAERSLFGVLTEAVNGHYLIFAKVRLADLVWLPKGTESRQSHMNRIQSKHIDFVLCDRDTIRPLVAIELDDSSHDRSDRVARDGFVDSALKAAGLPFVRVRARASYDVKELAAQIEAAIKSS
jgi:hypothetical protein